MRHDMPTPRARRIPRMGRVVDAPPKYVSRLYTPMAHLTDPTKFQLLIKVGAKFNSPAATTHVVRG